MTALVDLHLSRAERARDWVDDAACVTANVDFVPDVGRGQHLSRLTVQQRSICAGCPVQRNCAYRALEVLFEMGELTGVWAGVACTNRTRSLARAQEELRIIAGLPKEHRLAQRHTARDRRRHTVYDLADRGFTPEEISRAHHFNLATVCDDLHARDEAQHVVMALDRSLTEMQRHA